MADIAGSPLFHELEDLEEDIQLNTTLLASLEEEDDSDADESRRVIKRTLKNLRHRLKALQPQPESALSNFDGATGSAIKAEDDDSQPKPPNDRATKLMPPPTFDLVSRKRQRGDFDDNDLPESKSQRQSASPSMTGEGSPAPSHDSTDSFDYDDPLMRSLLGGDTREADEEHRSYMKNLEARKRQEEADAAFARRLQEEINQLPAAAAPPQQRPPSYPSMSASQSLFRPNGSINHIKQEAPRQVMPVKPEALSTGYNTPVYIGSEPSTPNSEDFEEIPAANFTSRHPGTQFGYGAASSSMPGAFPGSSQYGSVGGTAVYGAPYGASYGQPAYGGTTGVAGLRPPWDTGEMNPYIYPWMGNDVDPAKTQDEIKDLLSHIRPDEELTAQQKEQTPDGLNKNLMPHQASGLAWMKAQEEGTNKGGILADDMGLGKTLQAIALMLSKPPPTGQHCPTLIVAPVALLEQWKREMDKHVLPSHRLNVVMAHGASRPKRYTEMKHYDVVLTTYGLLAAELKKKHAWEERLKVDPNARPTPQQDCAILGANAKFHRIILDEAQQIKTRTTKSSVGACHIKATYRWCLTGTPMQNSVEEMYSLIRFCRIRPYSEFDKFQKDIGRPLKGRYEETKKKAMQQLQVLLRAILLRRTKKSEIDGKPIIQLPPKETVEDRAIFSKDELDFYKALETQSQIQFNKYIRLGSIGRNYSHALVLLLRLRQACCNPMLITNSKDFMQQGALEPFDMIENAKHLSMQVVERLKSIDSFECPVCMDVDENPSVFPCGHALCADCLAKLCDAALASDEGSQAKCPHCRTDIDTNKITDLLSFLRVHCSDREGVEPFKENEADATESESDDSDEESDSDDGEDLRDFIVPDDEDIKYDSDGSDDFKKYADKNFEDFKSKGKDKVKKKDKSRSSSRVKGKGKASGKLKVKGRTLAELRKEGIRNKSAKKKYLKKLSKDFRSSAKIEKTISLLEGIRANGEGEKTIIFSSFTSFLDLLEVPLSQHPDFGVYARYDGSMTPKDRNEAVLSFTEKRNCKVILVSLKAGNAGLNLTAANHVIIMDPFWNPFVEYQAADRCYRIGQERNVTIHRVLIGEGDEAGNLKEIAEEEERAFTVEDRILALQEKKRQLVETALDERAGEQVGRLGVRELGYLFGVNNLN